MQTERIIIIITIANPINTNGRSGTPCTAAVVAMVCFGQDNLTEFTLPRLV